MACPCPVPLESLNPRRLDSCLRCGRLIRGPWVVGDEQVEEFFDLLAEAGIADFQAFRVHCERREAWGRQQFKLSYLDRDLPAEGMEEAADLAIYAMLDRAKLHRDGFDPDVAADLLEAARLAALAHAALRRAQSRRRGSP